MNQLQKGTNINFLDCNSHMPRILISLLLISLVFTVSAQNVTFLYDQAGNRIKRLGPQPDLKPTMLLSPSTTLGLQTVTIKLRVFEVNNVASTGPTLISLRKISAMTAVGLILNNTYNGWIYKGLSTGYYHFEYPNGLNAEGVSPQLSLSVILDNQKSTGSTAIQTIIPITDPGVGGEINFENNSDATVWYYFNQF